MFKRGDIIKCIDAEESLGKLTFHKEYRVTLVVNSKMIMIIDDTNTLDEYFIDRFVLSVSRTIIRKMFANIK